MQYFSKNASFLAQLSTPKTGSDGTSPDRRLCQTFKTLNVDDYDRTFYESGFNMCEQFTDINLPLTNEHFTITDADSV